MLSGKPCRNAHRSVGNRSRYGTDEYDSDSGGLHEQWCCLLDHLQKQQWWCWREDRLVPDELNYVCRYARQLPESTDVCSGGTLRAGIIGASYWRSSEYNATRAWYQSFSSGAQAQFDGYKTTSIYVRVVRFFGP